MAKDPNDFGPYAEFLDTSVWPSERSHGDVNHVLVEDMSPNQAASCLAKLVRWARLEPYGDITLHPDEDSREEAVRHTQLGEHLAARAVNMTPEHFYAVYGEIGALPDASLHDVLAEIVVALGDLGLADWTWQDRIKLGAGLLDRLEERFRLKDKPQ